MQQSRLAFPVSLELLAGGQELVCSEVPLEAEPKERHHPLDCPKLSVLDIVGSGRTIFSWRMQHLIAGVQVAGNTKIVLGTRSVAVGTTRRNVVGASEKWPVALTLPLSYPSSNQVRHGLFNQFPLRAVLVFVIALAVAIVDLPAEPIAPLGLSEIHAGQEESSELGVSSRCAANHQDPIHVARTTTTT